MDDDKRGRRGLICAHFAASRTFQYGYEISPRKRQISYAFSSILDMLLF